MVFWIVNSGPATFSQSTTTTRQRISAVAPSQKVRLQKIVTITDLFMRRDHIVVLRECDSSWHSSHKVSRLLPGPNNSLDIREENLQRERKPGAGNRENKY